MSSGRPPSGGDGRPEHTQGRDPEDPDPVWYLPAGAASGERNRLRVRGWAIAVAVALLVWGLIACVVALVATLLT